MSTRSRRKGGHQGLEGFTLSTRSRRKGSTVHFIPVGRPIINEEFMELSSTEGNTENKKEPMRVARSGLEEKVTRTEGVVEVTPGAFRVTVDHVATRL